MGRSTTSPASSDRNLATVLTPTRAHWLSLDEAETAVRAAYAARIGLDGAARKLRAQMDSYADNDMTRPATAEFIRVYGDVVQAATPQRATDACEATCVATSDRRAAFLAQMSGPFWTALQRLHAEATSWHKAWAESARLAASFRPEGKKKSEPVPGIGHPPVHAVVTAAQEVVDALAGATKGLRKSTTLTLVREAHAARELLKNPELPGALGLETIDDVLDVLKLKIPRSAGTFEDELVTYVRAAVELAALDGIAPPTRVAELSLMGTALDWRHFRQP